MKSELPYTVLCIDDDSTALMVRSLILKQAGYAVITATTGDEAITVVSSKNVDLVLSDHHLVGTTGLVLAESIKALRPGILFVLLTGSPHLAEHSTHLDLVLTKGMDPRDLLLAIGDLMAKKNAA